MFFIIDIPTCNRLGLQGAEALVFSCLAFLCRDKGYWKGSYAKLAEYSLCGCDDTAKNCCVRLIEKGIISREGLCYRLLPKISGDLPKNSGAIPKNSGYSEKESTKEKEIKKECVNKEGTHTHDFLNEDSFSTVDKNTAAQFGTENGIPIEVVGKWWYHFDERGWRNLDGTKIRNWQSSLQKWFLHEKQMNMRLAGVPQKQVQEVVRNSRNEMIRRQQLEQQHREREQNDREGFSMPEHLAKRFCSAD